MPRLNLGASPNTLALLLGLGVLGLACLPPGGRPFTLRFASICLGLVLCAVALASTQSRAACLGLLIVASLWFGLYRRPARLPASLLLACAAALLLWLSLAGRAAPSALHTGASVRKWVHAAALMQAGEAAFSTPARVGGLAEDAAMRFGFPLGLEQGRMIKGPLSTLLAWLDPLCWPLGLLGWIGLVASACVWPRRSTAKPTPVGLSLLMPSAAIFTLVCAAFNCLHQDRLGRWLLPLLALAGWAWLGALLWQRRPRAAALGLTGAVAAAGMLLSAGYFLLRHNFREQGMDGWHVSRIEAPGGHQDALQISTTTAKPRGALLLFDHAPDTLASWNCRRALFRQAATGGWRLILAAGSTHTAATLDRAGPTLPVVAAGLAGPVPENVARHTAPAVLVHIDGGLVVWLTPDGAPPGTRRHWIATHAHAEADLDRSLALSHASHATPPLPHRISPADYAAWLGFWSQILGPPDPQAPPSST